MVTLNSRVGVHDLELFLVRDHFDIFAGHYAHDGEEGTRRFPAFRTSTGMIVGHIAGQGDLDLFRGAVTVQGASGKIRVVFGETVVDDRVEREWLRHLGGSRPLCSAAVFFEG